MFGGAEITMITTSRHRQTANDHDPRRRRSRKTRGLVALTSVMLAACASSTRATEVPGASANPATPASTVDAQVTPVAAHGVEAAITDVPWSKVGPGWMLAEWSPVTPHMPGSGHRAPDEPTPETATTTLYLVDPVGNRYTITTFAPGDNGAPRLIDWSADGSHALLMARYPAPATVTSLDLRNGTRSTVPVNGYPVYSGPDGSSLLVSTELSRSEPATLRRTDLSGHPKMSYPTDQLGAAGQFNGGYLESRDGTQLILGTGTLFEEPARSDNHLVVMSNDGKIIRTLPAPMPKARCSPEKWWSPRVILTHCQSRAGSQLWKVPLDGGAATALTAVNSGQEDDPGFGRDISDGDAWQLPSGTFLQSAGACGSMFLSRLTPDMHTTRVKIPGVSENIGVAGVIGDRLLLLAQVGCSGTTSLLTYDPAANASIVLLGPPVNGGGVSEALLYPGKP
jgi:hypothetical protein